MDQNFWSKSEIKSVIFKETTIDGDYTVIQKEPLSLPEGKENLDSQGRIVIDVVSPPKFNLQKSA